MLNFFTPIFLLTFTIFTFASEKITIYAAASTNNVISELTELYEETNSIKILTSFASSSTLAKQISLGAPADIFLSANTKWMDFLETNQKIQNASRKNLAYNSLVLVSGKFQNLEISFDKNFDFAKSFEGRIAIGDPTHVPAGIYAKEALEFYGWWKNLRLKVIHAFDVRSALTFVERQETTLGIVYATDARVSEKVTIIAEFPKESHSEIAFPIALTKTATPKANDFLKFLSSISAKEIFQKHGFVLKAEEE
ncbi:MAG: molybdate ABC transporter substrate-binding protein [Calditrichaeota bacterium]|nr:MAG: molybdate ABC transporter substrate-binding protein [Calditrichota bacterium]